MTSRKRASETVVVVPPRDSLEGEINSKSNATDHNTASIVGVHRRPKIKVKIKRFHAVAHWTWNCGGDDDEDVCGICQGEFEGVAPGVKYPGDECPVVWGKCGHAFHLQCISTWLGGNSTCPMCRSEWEFGAERSVDEEGTV